MYKYTCIYIYIWNPLDLPRAVFCGSARATATFSPEAACVRFRAWVLVPLLCALGSFGAAATRLGAWVLEPLQGTAAVCRGPLLFALGVHLGAGLLCAFGGLGAAGCRCCVRLGAWVLLGSLGTGLPLLCAAAMCTWVLGRWCRGCRCCVHFGACVLVLLLLNVWLSVAAG